MIVQEELKLEEFATDFYSSNLCKTENDVILNFGNVKLIFKDCLIFKCGYPNEEIYMHYDYYTQGSMKKYRLYELKESKWIKGVMTMNRVHARHTDEMFKRDRH